MRPSLVCGLKPGRLTTKNCEINLEDTIPHRQLAPVQIYRQERQSPAHRCLFVTEVLCLIFEYIREWDEYPPDDLEVRWDKKVGKATLASLARTCRAFHGPALDALWMKLDLLDPLIKLLPRRMWSKKHYPLVVRMFMREKHWLTFRKYASRVRSVRGPCWRLPSSVQHNVICALAKFPKASLPLLPNLTELVWSELKLSHLIDPTVSLLKYFVGPRVTKVSLLLVCWPFHVSSEMAVLSDLANLCPNVTSFTAFFPRSSHSDPSKEVGAIVSKWTKLRTLRSCALPQYVMDQLANRQSLESLSIELNNATSPRYVGNFPETLHQFSLGGNNAPLCTRYLESIHCSPESCSLRVGADDSTLEDISDLFRALPAHLDKTTLRSVMVELTSSYWSTPSTETFCLDLTLITPFLAFRSLTSVDLDLFSSAGLDDDAFDMMAKTWPNLRSLALGTCDVTRAKPLATINALISLLTHCPDLESLHIVFDGLVLSPSEMPQGVQNNHITKLQVGHSPIEDVNAIASSFSHLMPRLKRISAAKHPPDEVAKWAAVQKMLTASLRSQCIGTD